MAATTSVVDPASGDPADVGVLRRAPWTALAWSMVAVALALSAAYAVFAYLDRSVQFHAYGYLGAIPFDCLAFATVGGLIASRLPRNPMGWLFGAIGIILLSTSVAQLYAVRGLIVQPGSLPAASVAGWLGSWFWGPGVGLTVAVVPLLFPDGHPPGRRWRIYAGLAVGVVVLQALLAAAAVVPSPGAKLDLSGQYLGSLTGFQSALFNATYVVIVPLAAGSVASLFKRRVDADAVARQQLKYFLLAGVVVLVGIAASAVGNAVGRGVGPVYDISASILVTCVAAIPIAAGLAILRYRLYDIDVVISRTIVYAILAAFITGLYVGIVVGVGSLVGTAGHNNLLLSIVATALVALAFQPVRTHLQTFANRVVYGHRATPYEVLSSFSEGIGEAYAEEDVLGRMARLLGQATDAAAAAIWLRVGAELRPAIVWPEGSPPPSPVAITGQIMPAMAAPVAVPIRHSGEVLGAITLSRNQGQVSIVESKLIEDLARQAGLVMRTAGLTESLKDRVEELRASRQRLVAAQDGERRRIERNLHDGAQQHLVALKVKLGLLKMLVNKDPSRATALADELAGDTDEALNVLRDLARGIYPPLLADRGLASALEAQARKATVPVAVDPTGIGRYPQELEAAVYFCCLEALQNVQKYAAAATVEVRLAEVDGALTFAVRDDGRGFDQATGVRGAGLTNMADRLDALGGRLEIQSQQGRGTEVRGVLPLPS
jgi:signal transduction histidine kinase